MDILICDDDAMLAETLSDALRSAGYSVETIEDGTTILDRINVGRPKLVILDIMMPGVDGLTICKTITSDEVDASVPVLVMSGKRYGQTARKAMDCGASAFLAKPVELKAVLREVAKYVGFGGAKGQRPALTSPTSAATVRIWGCRGTDDGPREGIETSCVSLDIGDRRIILDAGSGIRGLCASPDPENKVIWLFFSHYHGDHIEGLRHLRYAFDPYFTLNMAGPFDTEDTFAKVVVKELEAGGTPAAQGSVTFLTEKEMPLWDGVSLSTVYTMHPDTTLAFRFDFDGKRIVYCPDNELRFGDAAEAEKFDKKLWHFIHGADLLIHDARFTDEDIAEREGLGHSSPGRAAELASSAGVKKLILFHADARYSAAQLDDCQSTLRGRMRREGHSLGLEYAQVGAAYSV